MSKDLVARYILFIIQEIRRCDCLPVSNIRGKEGAPVLTETGVVRGRYVSVNQHTCLLNAMCLLTCVYIFQCVNYFLGTVREHKIITHLLGSLAFTCIKAVKRMRWL